MRWRNGWIVVVVGIFVARLCSATWRCVPNPSEFPGLPISPLRCELIQTSVPLHLRFSGKEGGLWDKRSRGMGFRSLIPSKERWAYAATLLEIRDGRLRYKTGDGHWNRHHDRLVNPIGVGLPVPEMKIRMSTRVKLPKRNAKRGREKFCLFVGVSAEHFMSVCVVRTRSQGELILVRYERDNRMMVRERVEINGTVIGGDRVVMLQVEIFPGEDTIRPSYLLPEMDQVVLDDVVVDGFLLNHDEAATDIGVGTRTHGGIYAYHQWKASSSVYEVLAFDVEEIDDSVAEDGGGDADEDDAVDFDVWKVTGVKNPTSMSWAPDGRLFIAQVQGGVTVLRFNGARTAVTEKDHLTPIGNRMLLGIVVDFRFGTDGNDCVWLSHSHPSQRHGGANSGTITQACGPKLENVTDIIVGLPRAIANHATNNIFWGPEGSLYIAIGSNTASGAVNTLQSAFSMRPEQHFSAAILRADVTSPNFRGNCTPKQDPLEMDRFGIAAAEVPDCEVQLHATGTRNTFDCVWHPNGHLYCPDNGVGGKGSKPPLPRDWREGQPCAAAVDGSDDEENGGGNAIERHDTGVREDVLYDIVPGGYYGHPNPVRFECVLDAGNPTNGTDGSVPRLPLLSQSTYGMEFRKYPVGTKAHTRYRLPMASLGRNHSPNGIISYRSDAMCGQLLDELLIAYFSVTPQVRRIRLARDGRTIKKDSILRRSTPSTGAEEPLNKPLGIEQDDRGTIFVAEFAADRISVMVPKHPRSCPTPTASPSVSKKTSASSTSSSSTEDWRTKRLEFS